jgi:monoamine oxidase
MSFDALSCDVAVIGAGLAGLAATDYLVEKGIDAHLFEAQAFCGGRVFTRHLVEGLHFEEGALSFSDAEETLWKYVHRFSLDVIEQSSIDKQFHFRGLTGNFSDKGHFLEGEEKNIILTDLLGYYLSRIDLKADEPVASALKKAGASEIAMQWLIENTLLGLIGDSIENVSVLAMQAFFTQYKGSKKLFAFKGGNDHLPQALSQHLAQRVHLNFPIKKIKQCATALLLEGKQPVYAKKVILAVPLKALQQIEITPPLPKAMQEAMCSIPYTTCSRLTLTSSPGLFKEIRGGVVATAPAGWFRDQTLFQNNPDQATVVSLNCVGQAARKMQAETKRTQHAVAELKIFAPDAAEAAFEGHFYSWNEVAWIQGGYAYYPPGKFCLQKVLATAIGNVHFAGEHTSEKFASMNGALESGIRTAQEIIAEKLDLLKPKKVDVHTD